MSTAAEELTGLPDFTRWTPAGQERALDELNRNNLETWKPFYCPRPSCDGNHHITVHAPGTNVCVDGRVHDWVQTESGQWFCQRAKDKDGKACDPCHVTGTPDGDGWIFRHGRSDQHPPPGLDWLIWLLLAGRGAGKTRAGSEWVHRLAGKFPGCRIALISPTAADVRDTMIEGESGLLATARPGMVPEWEPSKKRLTYPNGSIAFGFSGEEPDRLRGKQHHFGWLDEPAHMELIDDVWSNFMFGLRLGKSSGVDPKVCLTTSPLPVQWLKDLLKEDGVVVSRASTYANLANLPEHYRTKILKKWEGTRTGMQEIEGLLLDDVEGALWNTGMLEDSRVKVEDALAFSRILSRINVAVDPAGTNNARSDETGITVQGITDDEPHILGDYSGKYSPDQWAAKVLHAYDVWKADYIVVETTYGKDLVRAVIPAYCKRIGRECPRIVEVDSRRGKLIRAEPMVALFERKQAHIVNTLPELETQLCSWVPGTKSPDRLDAMVHGMTDLVGVGGTAEIASPYDLLRRQSSLIPAHLRGHGLAGHLGRTSA